MRDREDRPESATRPRSRAVFGRDRAPSIRAPPIAARDCSRRYRWPRPQALSTPYRHSVTFTPGPQVVRAIGVRQGEGHLFAAAAGHRRLGAERRASVPADVVPPNKLAIPAVCRALFGLVCAPPRIMLTHG